MEEIEKFKKKAILDVFKEINNLSAKTISVNLLKKMLTEKLGEEPAIDIKYRIEKSINEATDEVIIIESIDYILIDYSIGENDNNIPIIKSQKISLAE